MLHYTPQHVSSSTLLILRRTNCITTASGIVTLCKQPYCMRTVRLFTEGDDTRGCCDTIGPPDDEQRAARNMLRSVVQHIYCWRLKQLCTKLVFWKVYAMMHGQKNIKKKNRHFCLLYLFSIWTLAFAKHNKLAQKHTDIRYTHGSSDTSPNACYT